MMNNVMELIRAIAYEGSRKQGLECQAALQQIVYIAQKELEYERLRLQNYQEILKVKTI